MGQAGGTIHNRPNFIQIVIQGIGGSELLHAYTAVLPTGFYVALLERRGGYDGYGSAGTHVRLAAQVAQSAQSAH